MCESLLLALTENGVIGIAEAKGSIAAPPSAPAPTESGNKPGAP